MRRLRSEIPPPRRVIDPRSSWPYKTDREQRFGLWFCLLFHLAILGAAGLAAFF